jgi:hypothetical protein
MMSATRYLMSPLFKLEVVEVDVTFVLRPSIFSIDFLDVSFLAYLPECKVLLLVFVV